MSISERGLVVAAALLLSLAACESVPESIPESVPASVVILLPGEDGSVGEVEVANAQGSQVLNQAHQSSALRGKRAPGEAKVLKPEDVERHFGETIAAVPSPAMTFILYFELDGATLTEASAALLPKILAEISRRPVPDVDAVGHTDRAGDEEYNAILAQWRAEEVRDKIVAIGVEASRIRVSSHGENNPLVATEDGVKEPRNRRVEVTVR